MTVQPSSQNELVLLDDFGRQNLWRVNIEFRAEVSGWLLDRILPWTAVEGQRV